MIPDASPDDRVVSLGDEAATMALAARIATVVRAGDVIALYGTLGAGKTVLARAFINTLSQASGTGPEEVPSPTFTLVQTYPFPEFTVWHVDLYRIEDEAEIRELGLDDAFAQDVTLIEWPDRLESLLPPDCLRITLSIKDESVAREARLCVAGDWGQRLGNIG
jgi:tRNA threonylcarbamoyladenosine biosynthesis protein TsaE